MRVTGAGLWQSGQGELFIYSNVSNRSRTEIESAAAPKNPLSLELPTVARQALRKFRKTAIYTKVQCRPAKNRIPKKVPRKWLNSKDP